METCKKDAVIIGDHQPEECEVCCEVFEDSRRPRTLPCGHSFCSHCITNMIQNRQVSCPNCRDRHYAYNANQFPVNYGLEALIRKQNLQMHPPQQNLPQGSEDDSPSPTTHFGGAQLSVATTRTHQNQRGILEREPIKQVDDTISWEGSEMNELIEECKTHVLMLQSHHRQVLDQLDDLLLTRHECLQDLIKENMATLVLLDERRDCLSNLSREGKEEYLKKAGTKAISNTSPCKVKDMLKANVEDNLGIDNVGSPWVKKWKVMLLDNRSENASKELLARTQEALRVTTLTDDIQRFDNSSSITVKDLKMMSEEVQYLLRKDLIFALQHKEGKSRFAKISVNKNKLYLHHLQDKTPPEDAKLIMYKDVYKLADTTSTLTFLDIGWNDEIHGRLQVCLHPATPRGRQFILLCTALWGPTYANTRLLAIGNKGSPSEFIRGGDYQYNNGTGGASLLPGLRRGGEYWRQQVLGSVMAAGSWGDACSAQFIISTRDPGLTQRDDTIYGQVDDGLHVLNAAIKTTRITQVTVADCGIIISL